MLVGITPWMMQTPTDTLHDIADLLWVRGEHAAYRSLKAYIKERDQMIKHIKELEDICPQLSKDDSPSKSLKSRSQKTSSTSLEMTSSNPST